MIHVIFIPSRDVRKALQEIQEIGNGCVVTECAYNQQKDHYQVTVKTHWAGGTDFFINKIRSKYEVTE